MNDISQLNIFAETIQLWFSCHSYIVEEKIKRKHKRSQSKGEDIQRDTQSGFRHNHMISTTEGDDEGTPYNPRPLTLFDIITLNKSRSPPSSPRLRQSASMISDSSSDKEVKSLLIPKPTVSKEKSPRAPGIPPMQAVPSAVVKTNSRVGLTIERLLHLNEEPPKETSTDSDENPSARSSRSSTHIITDWRRKQMDEQLIL